MRFIQLRSAPAQNAGPLRRDDDADGVVVGECAESSSQFDDVASSKHCGRRGDERDACYVAVDVTFRRCRFIASVMGFLDVRDSVFR